MYCITRVVGNQIAVITKLKMSFVTELDLSPIELAWGYNYNLDIYIVGNLLILP